MTVGGGPNAAAFPASIPPFPLILNLLKDGRQDFKKPRDFPYRRRPSFNKFRMSGFMDSRLREKDG